MRSTGATARARIRVIGGCSEYGRRPYTAYVTAGRRRSSAAPKPPGHHVQTIVAEEYFVTVNECWDSKDAACVGGLCCYRQGCAGLGRKRLMCQFRLSARTLQASCQHRRIANVALFLPQGIEYRVAKGVMAFGIKFGGDPKSGNGIGTRWLRRPQRGAVEPALRRTSATRCARFGADKGSTYGAQGSRPA